MKTVVIIPARGGSKSLPMKNILKLNGKPLLCYSIDYALESDLVTTTIVSTDSREIASIAKDGGAEVPFLRPAEFSKDQTRDYPVIRHALEFFEVQGEIFDTYILLRQTSPLRPAGLIEKALQILAVNPDASSVRSMAIIKEHPYRAWRLNNSGSICGFIETEIEPYNIPRQELPELLFQTGDIEAIRRDTIIKGSISGCCVYPLIIKHEDMIDIDSQSDFDKAERFDANRE